ncbi:ER degradation-enhancing alpha-mannosidase-like protein 1 [Podila humilis]|nr:ER degradation-enhancing alpha-mannosidase-like protein 1 [Podila humilis]
MDDVHGPTLDAAGPVPGQSVLQELDSDLHPKYSGPPIASLGMDHPLDMNAPPLSLSTSLSPIQDTLLDENALRTGHQSPTIVNNINNINNNNNNRENGMRPWVIFIVFTIVQIFLSSPILSNGVNASTSSDSSSGNGGSGNSASSAGVRGYFRVLPPILNSISAPGKIVTERMTETRRLTLRQEAKDMFMHGYKGYLTYAFPKDELNPIMCRGRGSDRQHPDNINVNDVLGDYSLTLIDSLDTLATMREPEEFAKAIALTKKHIRNFNINSRVQVFEVNIRVLGALLSAHQYASDPRFQSTVEGYKDELLALAVDLGGRLMKAFEHSPTGIPWPRVNLKKGLLKWESSETCVAGAGSLLLEFGTLSRLTGDPTYEIAAKRAMHELWRRRTKIGLVGNTINMTSGEWMSAMTGIGAGTDSFYEYLLKSYVLFGDDTYLEMYETAAEAIKRNLLHDSKYFYKHVHLLDGSLLASWVDSLSAFMPGVQVLAGDLESAIKNHLFYYNIWRKYQAIPERFNFFTQGVDIANYPLRPEFVESNYCLYRATKDPFYLEVGEMILRDLQMYTKTVCGWASLRSVIDRKKEDRMESFALSETFKYLFLLFDEENVLHNELKDTNFVFTTEGHVLSLTNKQLMQSPNTNESSFELEARSELDGTFGPRHEYVMKGHPHFHLQRQTDPKSQPICPRYEPPATFIKSIPYRPDADFARQMVGVRPDVRDHMEADPKGFCEKPVLESERVTVEFAGGFAKTFFVDDHDDDEDGETFVWKEEVVAQQEREKEEKKTLRVIPISKGVFVSRIVKVKMQLQYDDVHNGYRAVKGNPLWDTYQRQQAAHLRVYKPTVEYHEKTDRDHKNIGSGSVRRIQMVPIDFEAHPADFGYWRPRILDYNRPEPDHTQYPLASLEKDHYYGTNNGDGISQDQGANASNTASSSSSARTKKDSKRKPVDTKPLVRIEENVLGCRPFTGAQSSRIRGKILVLDRGGCLFILKAYYAQATGAYGLVLINTDENKFAMTGASGGQSKGTSSSDPPAAASSYGASELGDSIPDDDIDITSVMISHSEGQKLLDMIREEDIQRPDGMSSEDQPRLVAGFVQRKLSRSELDGARLSYNNLPIVNIRTLQDPAMATYG